MRVGIIGAGYIGRAVAGAAVKAGHEVMVSNSRSPGTLFSLTGTIGCRAGTAAEAAAFGELVLVAIPLHAYQSIPVAPLEGKIVLDASNELMAAAIADGGNASVARIQEANRAFHRALLDASGSPRLRTVLETMIDMPIIVRSFYLATHSELEQSLHHHQDLTVAAQAQDGELARQVMQLHLRMAYHRFMRHRDLMRKST